MDCAEPAGVAQCTTGNWRGRRAGFRNRPLHSRPTLGAAAGPGMATPPAARTVALATNAGVAAVCVECDFFAADGRRWTRMIGDWRLVDWRLEIGFCHELHELTRIFGWLVGQI